MKYYRTNKEEYILKSHIYTKQLGLLVSAMLFILLSCHAPDKGTGLRSEEVIPVKIIALAQDHSNKQVHTSGIFTTDDETFLSFKNGGIIDRIYVREGDKVTQGQLLATVKNTEVNAGMQQTVLAYQKADRDYQRALKLYKDSVGTLEQLQNAKTAADIARQQVSMVKFNQDAAGIRATASGYVLERLAVEGQTAGPGVPVIKINGAGKGDWFLKVGINDRELNMIGEGDRALIYTDALPGKVLNGIVDKKSKGADPASGTFTVYIKLTDKKLSSLAYGMFAKAIITPGKQNTNWKIPYSSLLDGQEGSGFVFITNDGRTAKRVPVVINSIDKDGVLISSGLDDAKFLIRSGSAYLNDGSKIKIIK